MVLNRCSTNELGALTPNLQSWKKNNFLDYPTIYKALTLLDRIKLLWSKTSMTVRGTATDISPQEDGSCPQSVMRVN